MMFIIGCILLLSADIILGLPFMMICMTSNIIVNDSP